MLAAPQGRAGRPREATLQLAEMARLGVQPDAMAATALVDACARNGKMEMALSVFDELFGEPLFDVLFDQPERPCPAMTGW